MSTGLVVSQAKTGTKTFSKPSFMKNSTTFSIQKPTKAFIGISQSKSSSDINGISGNLAANIVSSTTFANVHSHMIEQDHSTDNTNKQPRNKSLFAKIPKSLSTSGIKQSLVTHSESNAHQLNRKLLLLHRTNIYIFLNSRESAFWDEDLHQTVSCLHLTFKVYSKSNNPNLDVCYILFNSLTTDKYRKK